MSRNFESTNRWLSKRNFQNYMITWLGTLLGVGPALGEIFFVAGSTTQYYDWLLYCGVKKDHIVATLYEAEALTTGDQNDVVCVAPGATVETLETDWDKSYTHIVGLGGPMRVSDYYCAGTMIYTATATCYNLLHVTGNNCQIHRVGLYNNGAAAGCVSALKVGETTAGYNNKFYDSHFCGLMNSTQRAVETAASVRIASGASDYYFKNCIIGHNCWGARTTAKQGHVYFGGTTESGASAGYGPQNGTWEDCLFLSQGTTTTCVAVRVEAGGNEAMDRSHFFTRCIFDNYPGSAATMTQVFDDNCLTWHHVRISYCAAHGYGEWYDLDNGLYTIVGAVANATDTSIGIEPTA